MKKLFILKNSVFATFFTTLLVIGGGCDSSFVDESPLISKEILGSESLDFMKIENKKIIFKDFESYRSLLENPDLLESFYATTSQFRKENNQKYFRVNNEDESDNEFLDQLLDDNQMVTIGEYTFRVDMPNKSVFAVPKNSSLENSLIQKDYSLKGVMKFSTDDDVLYLLEEGFFGSPKTENSSILCGGGCPSYDLSTTQTPFAPTGNYYYTRVRYVKAGIYFELSYHFYIYWGIAPLILNNQNQPSSTHIATYQGNCRRSDLTNHENNNQRLLMSVTSADLSFFSALYNYKNILWRRSEGLRRINLTVNFDVPAIPIFASSQTINCGF